MKYALKAVEAICIVLLIVFVGYMAGNTGNSNRTAEEVESAVIQSMDMTGLKKRDNGAFRTQFSYDMADFEGVVYYTSESIMDVREMLIVKLPDGNNGDAFKEQLRTYADERAALYESYAPDEFYLLSNCVLEVKGNFLFFCVADDAAAAYESFCDAL